MIWKAFAAVGRHHRAVLVGGAVAGGACLVARWWAPDVADRIMPPLIAATFALLLLSVAAYGMPRDAGFDVQPEKRALRAAQHPAGVLLMLGQICLLVLIAGANTALIWLLVVVLAFSFGAAFLGTGIELRPDGVRERFPLGSQFVPWEAAPVVERADRSGQLPIRYERPELVRRRGLVLGRRWMRSEAVHPLFAAEAIRYYATLPEERAAIGTADGYARLQQATGFDR